MELKEAMGILERAGTAQNRKVYSRHGIGSNQYGVSYASLGALAKKIGTDQPLAEALWETGNHDARVLATMIVVPHALSSRLLDRWANSLDNTVQTDALSKLAARTKLARKKAEAWAASKGEWTGQAGWVMIGQLAGTDRELPDAYFAAHLRTIAQEIHGRKNRVRHAMNGAIICIGLRNPALEKKALATAKRVGRVEVDHGETGCKTPDAAAYIERASQRAKVRNP